MRSIKRKVGETFQAEYSKKWIKIFCECLGCYFPHKSQYPRVLGQQQLLTRMQEFVSAKDVSFDWRRVGVCSIIQRV